MANILFVRNGQTGRFRFLATALARRGHACALINEPNGGAIEGVPCRTWKLDRGSTPGIFEPATRVEADFLRGRAAADCALRFRDEGFHPDLIIGHPGWGEMLFLGEVFPGVPQIQLGEFYYRSQDSESGVDPEFLPPRDLDGKIRLHAKNAGFALSYAAATRIVVPTPFQASVIPSVFHPLVRIIHEGVDTDAMRPNPQARITIQETGTVLSRSSPVVTFINRHFEPVRGFHVFMRALPRLLAAVPDAHVLLIGTDSRHGYGAAPARADATWRQIMLEEVGDRLDHSRVHFPGPLPYDLLATVLSLSRAHVYLTHPFVLSWSLLDAMACECLIVGSDTEPVRDVIRPGVNGLLVPFHDHDALADALIGACRAPPERYAPLRRAARATAVRDFDRARVCEPAWLALIDEVLGAHSGATAA